MRSFEEMFGVCPEHRLVLVKSRSVGGDLPIERWDHEEFDHRGRLVARYETFIETDPVMGTVRSGWYRYDADGFLADWEEDLPEFEAELLATLPVQQRQPEQRPVS
jgi:hypothetical protein